MTSFETESPCWRPFWPVEIRQNDKTRLPEGSPLKYLAKKSHFLCLETQIHASRSPNRPPSRVNFRTWRGFSGPIFWPKIKNDKMMRFVGKPTPYLPKTAHFFYQGPNTLARNGQFLSPKCPSIRSKHPLFWLSYKRRLALRAPIHTVPPQAPQNGVTYHLY